MSKQTKTTLAAFLATSVATFAGTTTKATKPLEKEPDPIVSGVVGIEAASSYINKGRQFDSNLVFQPFAAVILPTKLELGGVKLSVVGSTKQNLHTQNTLRGLARSEYNTGIVLNKDRFTLTSTYEWTTSDNNWFPDAQGVNLTLSYDDSGVLPVALKPYAKTYLGVKRNNQPVGNYYEVGISPSVHVGTTDVSFPASVGFGNRNFYVGGERFGYASVGVSTSTPLTDRISLVTGITYLNTNENINAGNKNLWLTSAGVVVSF